MKFKYLRTILRLGVTVLLTHVAIGTFAQDKPFLKNATVFLVRHAEKDTGDNPGLTAAGRRRAGFLVSALEGNAIQKVFVSQYKRTQQTADSLLLKFKADTVRYMADLAGTSLMLALKNQRIKNDKVLIIGHSNTIPILIGRLGITKRVSMADDEYDTIYLIKYVKGTPMLFRKKYGDPLVQESNSSWEEVL